MRAQSPRRSLLLNLSSHGVPGLDLGGAPPHALECELPAPITFVIPSSPSQALEQDDEGQHRGGTIVLPASPSTPKQYVKDAGALA